MPVLRDADASYYVRQEGEALLIGPFERNPKPWAVDGTYFNFTERPCEVDAILPEKTCERLAHVKRSWDPDDVILANHSVVLATA